MIDELYPYTVSAVVNTLTGELVSHLQARPGHEDFDRFDAVDQLRPYDQFRWVHVWAANADAATATDDLFADLRAGGNRNRPVARALAGEAGLKPYTVAALTEQRTEWRAVIEPVVVTGHHDLDTAFEGRRRQRPHTAQVWAHNRADAIDQVFGTSRAARGDPIATPTHAHGDTAAPTDPRSAANAAAEREWRRQTDRPPADRVALVADTVWQHGYPPAYRAAYTDAASQIAAAATSAAQANRQAWLPLHHLAAAAGDAISRLSPSQPLAPPADRNTLAAAQAAATPGRQPPWQRVADAAWVRAQTAGTLHGSLIAATDILIGWRGRAGDALAEQVSINGRPGRGWVAELLATVNRDIGAPTVRGTAPTAVQLARQDQAPGVTAADAAAAVGAAHAARRRSDPAPAATTSHSRAR